MVISNRVTFLPLDRTGNRRFLPILIDTSKAEVHILEDERESERYIEQVWAEALMIYAMGEPELKLPDEDEKELTRIQRYFMPEDDCLGMIIGYLDKTKEASVCSRMLYHDAFGITDEPRNKDLLEINDVMNAGIASKEIVGWKRYEGARYFSDYGKQRGWERVTAVEPEFTEVQCELPEGLFDDKPSSQ